MTDVDDLDPLMNLTYDEPLLPARETFPADTARAQLVADVRDTLHALPAHFASKTFIEGLEAGDLFSLNRAGLARYIARAASDLDAAAKGARTEAERAHAMRGWDLCADMFEWIG